MTGAAAAKAAVDRVTRRPTGKPSWPFLLIAGREGAGKSWSAAEASASDLIGRTLWVGVGEDDPDEYALIKGADFEIVQHDGTYRDILAAVEWATTQTSPDGRPVLVVVDSVTRVWDLLCDMAQDAANDRARRKRNQPGNRGQQGGDDVEADIHMDLWNVAKGRWANIVDTLRSHHGPVIVTARMDEVTVMAGGKPTTQKEWRVKAEKSLPYDVTHIVELPERGAAFLAKAKTARMEVPRRIPLPGFTVDRLWRDLGLAEVAPQDRAHSGIDRGQPTAPVTQIQPGGDDRVQVARLAGRAAVAAAKAADVPGVEDIRVRASQAGLLDLPVAAALTAEWAAQCPEVTPAVRLGEWIDACRAHVERASDSVANAAAAAGDPWAVPPTDGARDGADTEQGAGQ